MSINKHRRIFGFSLLEAVVAIAVFALLSASIVTLSLGSFNSLSRSDELNQAEALAAEGVLAVKAIAAQDWSALSPINSGLAVVNGNWQFLGEGTADERGDFRRQVSLTAVCRDQQSDQLVDCPQGPIDNNTIKAKISITWQQANGQQLLGRELILSNQLASVEPRIACAQPPQGKPYTLANFYGVFDRNNDGQLSGEELSALCASSSASGLQTANELSWRCGRSYCAASLLANGSAPSSSVKLSDSWNMAGNRLLTRDKADRWYVAYVSDGRAWYRRSPDNGLSWELPVLISNDTGVSSVSIASDNNNRVHFVWSSGPAGSQLVKYRRLADSQWSVISTVSANDRGDQLNPVLAVDATDNIHVAWQGKHSTSTSYQQIRYAKISNGVVSAPVALTTTNYNKETPTIAVDRLGRVHVAWSGYYPSYRQIFYRFFATGAWRTETLLTSGSYHQLAPTIAVDAANNPLLVWYGQRAGGLYQIRFRQRIGGSWQSLVNLTSDAYAQTKASLAIGSQGAVDVFWQGAATDHPGYQTIKHRRLSGSVWDPIQDLQIKGQNPLAITAVYGSGNQLSSGWAYVYDRDGSLYFESGK